MSQTASSNQRRTPEEIQADIDQTRERLARNLDQLKTQTHPQVLIRQAKARLAGLMLDPQTGELRVERVVTVVGVVVGVVVVRKGIAARAHRKELRRLGEVVWVPVPRVGLSQEYLGIARDAKELTAA